MPKVKEVKPLFKLSAKYIAENIHYWCNPIEVKSYPMPEILPKYNNNSFDYLPLVALKEVIKALKKCGTKKMKVFSPPPYRPYQKTWVENGIYVFFDYTFFNNSYNSVKVKEDIFKNLMSQQLRELDLSQIRCPSEIYNLLDVASFKCPTNLENLNLQNISNFNCGIFFAKFEHLQVLNISHSAAEDIWLQIIGSSCKFLRELDVSFCRRVTDNGIQGLCVSYFDNQDRKNALVGLCKSIEKLNITRTNVTNKGVQMALQYLPSLKSITHCTLIHVLADVAQTTLDDKKMNPLSYSLSELSIIHVVPYKSGSLESVLNLCPLIVKIDLEVPEGFTNNDLLSIRFLKRLRELKLCDIFKDTFGQSQTERSQITVDGGLCPLLKEIGSSLEILNLSCFVGLNVSLIAKFCPNLRSLNLDINRSFTLAWPVNERIPSNPKFFNIEPPVLRHLVELRLECLQYENEFNDCHFLSEHLMLLLSSSSLISVTIDSCNLFTDELLGNLVKLHHFQNLKKLELFYCQSITELGLSVLMKDSNGLEKIIVKCCEKLGPKIIENLKTLALKKNWKLSIVDSS